MDQRARALADFAAGKAKVRRKRSSCRPTPAHALAIPAAAARRLRTCVAIPAAGCSRLSNTRGKVLVATDLAARGLDVADIDVVVNYDLPVPLIFPAPFSHISAHASHPELLKVGRACLAQVAKGASGIEQYVHRCGRTGRRAEAGLAVSYYDPVADKNSAAAIADLLRQSGAFPPQTATRGTSLCWLAGAGVPNWSLGPRRGGAAGAAARPEPLRDARQAGAAGRPSRWRQWRWRLRRRAGQGRWRGQGAAGCRRRVNGSMEASACFASWILNVISLESRIRILRYGRATAVPG